jgi:hypothetical protein
MANLRWRATHQPDPTQEAMMRAVYKKLLQCVGASTLVLAAVPAQAQDILFWVDDNLGTNIVPSAFTVFQASRPTATLTTATSQSDFNTKLASGLYEVAVFGEQDGSVFNASSAGLTAFLSGGGRVLGATWQSSPMAAFFGATRTSTNQTQISGSGALFAGVSSPLSIINPATGWGVFSQGYSGAGTCYATWGNGHCAAIAGNGGSTLLLGPLFDTYGDQAQGAQFVANALGVLAPTSAVPEPSTVALLGGGLTALLGLRLRRRRV